jgi:hypothetical protein
MRHLAWGIALLLVFTSVGCGSAQHVGSGQSASTPRKSASSAKSATSDASDACPLSQQGIDAAFDTHVPRVPGPATAKYLCSFATTKDGGIDYSKPSVAVERVEGTLRSVRDRLAQIDAHGITDVPRWGAGSFMQLQELPGAEGLFPTGTTEIDLFVPPSVHVLAYLPPGGFVAADALAGSLGDQLSD